MYLKILTALHILGAAVFVGNNVLLERVTKRSEALPTREAARLSELLGVDLTWMNSAALILLGVTGLLRMIEQGTLARVAQWDFIWSAYGAALIVMIVLWVAVSVNALLMTMYFRPRLSPRLPYGSDMDLIAARGDTAMSAASWITLLGKFNLVLGVVTLVEAGFLSYGGFKTTLPSVIEEFARTLGAGQGALFPEVLAPVSLLVVLCVLAWTARSMRAPELADRRKRFFSHVSFKVVGAAIILSDIYVVYVVIRESVRLTTGPGAFITVWLTYLLLSASILALLLYESFRRVPPAWVTIDALPDDEYLIDSR